MHKNKLLSGRVKTTPAANVTSNRYDYLGLEQAEPNLGTAAANGYVLTYNTNSTGNRLWAPGGLESNLAYAQANAAFNAANNAVDTWVRDAANSASSYANSAFITANSAGSYANGAFITANSAGVYANSSFETANSSGVYANSAFQTANSSSSYANSAYQTANSASSYANSAFVAANTADQKAVSAGSYANSAYQTANSASSYANGSFAAANTADQKAVTSGDYANSAYQTANSSSSYANGAFAAANTKLPLTGGTISGDLTVTGNLVVEGNTVIVNVSTLVVEDSLIQLARNNITDAVDIGLLGHYNSGSGNVHTGIIRSAADDTYYLFDNYPIEPTTNVIDTSNAQFRIATLKANLISDVVSIRGYDPINHTNNAYQTANSAGSYANGAFAAANTADQKAVTSGTYANSAYIHANAAFNAANNAVDTWVRDAANSASSYANGAFTKANTANTLAQAAYDAANNATDTWVRQAANSASSYANSSYVHANAAFDRANAGYDLANSAFNASISLDTFTGTGSCTTFTLSVTPSNENYTLISIDGVLQHKSAYNISGSNVVFSEAPANSTKIDATTFTVVEAQKVGVAITLDSFTGDNSCTTFTLSTTPPNENYTSIIIDGVVQFKSSYNISSSNVIFSEAPANGTIIEVTTFQSSDEYVANTLAQAAFNKANTANTLAQAAYDAANNATDTWVRNAANAASSYANSAFNKANTANTLAQAAYDAANNAVDTWVRDAANSASSYANGAFAAANTADQRAVTSGDYANSAFGVVNSASSYANSAFVAANTADQKAVTSGSYANSAYIHANAAFNAANNAVDTWVRDAANSASSYANSAYQTANSAGSYANGAFATANTKFNSTGGTISGDVVVTGNLTISGQTTYANTTVVNLGDSIITLNADIPQATAPSENAGIEVDRGSSANVQLIWNESTDKWTFTNDGTNYSDVGSAAAELYANGAFAAANTADQKAVTAGDYANSAYQTSNSSSSYANGAFVAANTADQKAVSAGSYANSAYQTANSAGSYANGAFVAANTADQKAVSAGSYANSSYIHANAAFNAANSGSSDSWARSAANAASSYANSGYIHANSAFDKANAGYNLINSSFGVSVTVDNFDGDGACTTFTLSTNPASENFTLVTLNGITQHKSAYNISGSSLVFSEAPNNTVDIEVITFTSTAVDRMGVAITLDSFTGDNSCTTFALTTTPTDEKETIIVIDGVTQLKTSYNISGANVVFSEAPGTNSKIEVTTFTPEELQYVGIGVQVDNFTGDNTTTTFTLTGAPVSENYTTISIDGTLQHRNTYNISGANVVFSEAPPSNASIEVTTFTASEVIFGTQANAAYAHANAAFNAANNATDTWVRNAANSASSYANSAFDKANTANTLAQAAFDAANNATDTWVRNAANAASSYANSAFGVANSASSYANGAFLAANTADQKAVTSGDYANSAFTAANTADQRAVTSGAYANGAFGVANSASSYANGAFAAANGKLSLTGGTISGDLTVTGNLVVEGNTVIVNVSTLSVEDSLIQLARNNTADAVDIGFIGHYNTGSGNIHTGLVRSAGDDTYYLFDNYPIEPTTNVIDTSNAQFRIATLRANLTATVVNIRGYDPVDHTNNAYQVANSGSSYANGAFVAANTADQRAVTSGTYANSAFGIANSASSYANGAFAAANTADQKAVSAGSYANSSFGVANSASSYANGAFAAANTADQRAVTSGDYANSAFAAANIADQRAVTSGSYANSAFSVANSSSSYANGAFAAANTADQRAVTSGSYANSAYIHANAAFNAANTGGSGTDSWARSAVNAASSYANSAYNQANTANTLAQAAFDAANSATGTVGTLAYTHANAAFNVANTAASGGQLIYVDAIDTFTSNGQNTTFTLSTVPTSSNNILVYIDGVYQQTSAYTLSGATLTMSEAVDANSTLQVRTFANTTTAHIGVTIDTFTGTGACTTFTLTSAPVSKNLTSVIVGGVPQLKSAYTITGTSLVFTGAPANNALIEVAAYKGGGSYATSFTSKVDTFAGNGSANTFTLSTLPASENETFVYLNGVYQNKSTYSISGANIVFLGTATSNDTIEVVTVAGSEMNVTSSRYNTRTYTANGAQTTFTISSGHTANSILVFENGICQEPIADYTVSGTTLTFTTAPAANVRIQIRELPV